MASSIDFVEYVCEQIIDAGEIKYKSMFGDYGIYCNGKFIGVVCNNQFFVKKTEPGASILINAEEASPYQGAKPCFVVDQLEGNPLLIDFVRMTCEALPPPKPRRKAPSLI